MWAEHFIMGRNQQIVCDKMNSIHQVVADLPNWNSIKWLKHAYVYAMQNPQF